jgi:hypothetical protein
MSEALSLTDIANLIAAMPRIPKRELHCHPFVVVALRNMTRDGEYTAADELARLTGIDIFEDATLPLGCWKLKENGEVVKWGNIISGTVAG